MSISFLSITDFMDPVAEQMSLRQLANRHRWPTGRPQAPISLRQIGLRHVHPKSTRHRFLWYNTFLLQGFELSLCNLIIIGRLAEKMGLNPREILKQMGINPAQVIEVMKISKSQLVKGLGISLDTMKNRFASVVDGLVSAATFGLVDIGMSDILGKISINDILNEFDVKLDDLFDKLKLDPLTVLGKFCKDFMQFVQDKTGFNLDVKVLIGGKPERSSRAKEIGAALEPDYDIMALCEVFETSSQDLIAQKIAAKHPDIRLAFGPDDTGALASSGLMSIVTGRKTGPASQIAFKQKGDPIRDTDAWSNKGVLRIVVDVGLGKLEIYSTHLLSGNDLGVDKFVFGTIPNYEAISAAQVQSDKLAQLAELVQFIKATHDPRNIAVVVGDFNLEAHNPAHYEAMIAAFKKLNMLDAWPYHRHRHPPSLQDNVKDLEGLPVPRGDSHAGKDGGKSSDVGKVCDPLTAKFCNEAMKTKTTSRIDYVFVEKPRSEHTFTLDFTRIQRRPFHRPNATGEKFLSDHLGLDLVFLVSPA